MLIQSHLPAAASQIKTKEKSRAQLRQLVHYNPYLFLPIGQSIAK